MAFLGGLFGGKKKKAQEDVGERTMLPWEVPGGQQYLDINKARSLGQGVGYRPEILSGVTSAYAKQRRGGLEGYEIPAITSGASARGLGRSSVVTSQIGRAEQEAGRDIEERVAQMALADEEQRRKEMQQAIQNLGSWTEMGVGASGQRAKEGIMLNEMYDTRSRVRKAEEDAFRNKLIATGGSVLSPLLSAIPGAGPILGSMTRGATGAASGTDIDDTLSELMNMPASQVNMSRAPVTIGGQGYNPPTLSQLYRMKGRG